MVGYNNNRIYRRKRIMRKGWLDCRRDKKEIIQIIISIIRDINCQIVHKHNNADKRVSSSHCLIFILIKTGQKNKKSKRDKIVGNKI